MNLPHQGLLDVADLDGNDLQLAFKDIMMLAAKMHHYHVPFLVSVILSPVPFKLLESLLGVIKTDGEVVHGLAVGVVELVDPLDTALQILDPLLNLDDGNIEDTMVDR